MCSTESSVHVADIYSDERRGKRVKIGFFDSGLGGLSVLHKALGILSGNEYIYYADEKNVPYGEKTREQIIAFTDNAVSFMVSHGAKAIVIACNTATSCAINTLREKYGSEIPIVGMEPAVKLAMDKYNTDGRRVLITATPVTVREKKLASLIERVDTHHSSDTLALPELVRFAESMEFDSPGVNDYLKQKLSYFELDKYSSLVLGCTHFNYFKDTFAKLLPSGVALVDGCEGTVKQLAHLTGIPLVSSGDKYPQSKTDFYFSGRACTQEEVERIKLYLKRLDGMQKISHS